MFNFSGSEIVFLLLLALIVLGPEKLPEAIRKFGSTYAEFKKVTTGFQTELKQALDEPVREMRETAEMLKQAATFDVVNPAEEVKKAAIGTFPAANTGTTGGTPSPAPTGDATAATTGTAADSDGSGTDATDPGAAAPADDARPSIDPTDPGGAAPPRVSQIAQANASANQPFARAAAAAADADAAAAQATPPASSVPRQYVQRMRTLDEVFGANAAATTDPADPTTADPRPADHEPPSANGAGATPA